MVKFLKVAMLALNRAACFRPHSRSLSQPGKVVIVLSGRYAGKKAVIVKNHDEGTTSKSFGHALLVGLSKEPRKVNRFFDDALGTYLCQGGSSNGQDVDLYRRHAISSCFCAADYSWGVGIIATRISASCSAQTLISRSPISYVVSSILY